MVVYTLTKTPEVAILADGVKAIVAADNTGAGILVDLFNYIQNPENGNPEGIKLKYLSNNKVWVLPNGNIVLFNVATNQVFLDLNKKVKNYSKGTIIAKPAGCVFGFLATDDGIPFELNPQELMLIKPQALWTTPLIYYVLNQTGTAIKLARTGLFFLPNRKNTMLDYAYGGSVLDQSGQTYNIIWKLFYDTEQNEILLKRTDQVENTMLFYETEIDGLTFSFDANMRPVVGYIRQGNAHVRFYDISESRYKFKDMGIANRVYLTPNATGNLLALYQRDNKLYYRQHADHYESETLLGDNIPDEVKLYQAGLTMQSDFRILFKGD